MNDDAPRPSLTALLFAAITIPPLVWVAVSLAWGLVLK